MAGLAKSPRECRTTIIRVKDKKEFIKQFNEAKPSKEFFEAPKMERSREFIKNILSGRS